MTGSSSARATAVHPSAAVYTPSNGRVAQLADIRRAASLENIRLEVAVAHTNQRLRARFCVSLRRGRSTTWAFGVEIKEAKQFEAQLVQLTKSHKGKKCSCRATTGGSNARNHSNASDHHCAMCVQLRQELKQWPKFPPFSTVGKRHMDAKCEMLSQFFYRLFRLLSMNAQWLQSCELLREMLRMTEALCRVQYEDDSAVVGVIESLKRVTPVIRDPMVAHGRGDHNANNQLTGVGDCSICLSSLYEPAETTALLTTADATHQDKLSSQPTQGVELPCGHRFHDSCICLWFHTRLNCPVCRQETTASN